MLRAGLKFQIARRKRLRELIFDKRLKRSQSRYQSIIIFYLEFFDLKYKIKHMQTHTHMYTQAHAQTCTSFIFNNRGVVHISQEKW